MDAGRGGAADAADAGVGGQAQVRMSAESLTLDVKDMSSEHDDSDGVGESRDACRKLPARINLPVAPPPPPDPSELSDPLLDSAADDNATVL